MLRNYLITTLRQMRRKPGFYALNIGGLAVGIAAFVLMFEHASYQLSFDKFNDRSEDVYRVNFNYALSGRDPYHGAAVFAGVGPSMKAEFPQVEAFTRLVSVWGGGGILRHEDTRLKAAEIQYAESSIFNVLGLEVIEGNTQNGLDDVHTAMLSEQMHKRLFAIGSGLGKTIEVLTRDGVQNFLITGIYRVPANSHYTSDLLLSMASLEQMLGFELDAHWTWFDYITYVRLQKGTDKVLIEGQFPAMIDKYATGRNRNNKTISFDLMPVTDIHLHSHINQEIRANGDHQTVIFLLVIAVLILTIAWINYINLYTAQATERGKEVGLRKTLGAAKAQLRMQFLLEALLTNLLAAGIAVLLISLSIPALEQYLGLYLPASLMSQPEFWLRLLGIWILGSVFSGSYPALLIAGFEPLKALKSSSMERSGRLRRGLVVWQFMASAALIAGAGTVHHQLNQMNAQDTGMDTDDVVMINVPQFRGDANQYHAALNGLKTEYLSYPGVRGVSYSSDVPGTQVGWRGSSRLINSGNEEQPGLIYKMVIGQEYLPMYGIPLLTGRNFERASDSLSVILNEKALQLYGFAQAEEAIGKQIYFTGVDTLLVIGVVKDHYQESLKEPLKPTAFLHLQEELSYLYVKLAEGATDQFITNAEAGFLEYFPELTFDWQPLTDQMANRHAGESDFLKAFNAFVLLSLIISALGLTGLAAYLARKRQKEMGLRKVLGASIKEVIFLFFKDFALLALLGNLIALPFIFYFANQWLDQFSFRTTFMWWLPALALGLCLTLSFMATIHHVWKLARLNPAKVLNQQ